MMIGRPKTALKKSTGKIRKSTDSFAFYLLLSPKDEPLLFCDIKPNKSPKRFRTPALIERHLQQSRLLAKGLGNLKGFRSCAGVVSWSEEKLCFQVTSRVGGATPSLLNKALSRPPLSAVVGSYVVAEPEKKPESGTEQPAPDDTEPVDLEADLRALEQEAAFELTLAEALTADTEALAAEIAAGTATPEDVSALGMQLLAQTTLQDAPGCLAALQDAAGDQEPLAGMLAVLVEDFARCKGEVSLSPTQALRDDHLARLPPEGERGLIDTLIPRLYHLFRGGKPAACAAGRRFALSQSGGDSSAVEAAYGSLTAEQRDVELGVLMLHEGGLIGGNPPQLKADYAADFGELRGVIDGMLRIYAQPTADGQSTLSWISDSVSELVGLSDGLLDTLGPYLEELEADGMEEQVTAGVSYRCTSETVLLEHTLSAADLSAGTDTTFSAEAAINANSTGAVQIKGGKVNLTGEVKLGATAEAKLTNHSGFSYRSSELFAVDLTGKVAVGAEVEAYGVITVKDGVVRIRLRSSASAGVGGGLDGTVTINHAALVTALTEADFYSHLAQSMGAALAGLLEALVEALTEGLKAVEGAGESAVEVMGESLTALQSAFPSFSGDSSDFTALLTAITP